MEKTEENQTNQTDKEVKSETIMFTGGCFWSLELRFQRVIGVIKTQVGYIGGDFDYPCYKLLCTGETNHAECVRIEFDPQLIPLKELIQIYFEHIDPTQLNKQGLDEGTQYRTGIFYTTEEQKLVAEEVRDTIADDWDDPIVTEITEATRFWKGEDHHQQYLVKNGQSAEKDNDDIIFCYG